MLKAWTDELQAAFAAYPEFVARVTSLLPLVERRLSDLGLENAALEARVAVLEAAKESAPSGLAPEAQREMNSLLERFERELESTRAAADSATRELTTLKRELQSRDAEIERLRAAPVVEKPSVTPRMSKPKKDLPEKQVLLIDDAEVNRVLLSHYLKGMPVQVDFARSLALGAEQCSRKRYDLVILDSGLREDDSGAGIESLEAAKGAAPLVPTESVLVPALGREAVLERISKSLWNAL